MLTQAIGVDLSSCFGLQEMQCWQLGEFIVATKSLPLYGWKRLMCGVPGTLTCGSRVPGASGRLTYCAVIQLHKGVCISPLTETEVLDSGFCLVKVSCFLDDIIQLGMALTVELQGQFGKVDASGPSRALKEFQHFPLQRVLLC